MKLPRSLIILAGALFAVVSVQAAPASAVSLSQSQLSTVVDNCYIDQVGLQQLRRSDVVLRINLGNLYGAVIAQASAFTTRLGNDNIKSKAIIQTTQSLDSTDSRFQADFNSYAILLENGLSLDCSSNPQQYYNVLTQAQEARSDTNQDVQNLNKELHQYIQEIAALKPTASSTSTGGSQ